MKRELVLLHGWGVDSRIWHPLLPALETTFNVTPLDLPGYGSSRTQRFGETLEKLADSVFDRAPVSATWCGWSLGGMVAIIAAIRQPKRIEQLNLVSTTPRFMMGPTWPNGTGEQAMDQLAEQFATDLRAGLLRFLVMALHPLNDARRLARMICDGQVETNVTDGNVLNDGLAILRNADLRNELAQLTCPVHLLTGRTDKIISPEASRYLAETIANSTLTRLGTSHLPFLDQPEEFVAWLKQTVSPPVGPDRK